MPSPSNKANKEQRSSKKEPRVGKAVRRQHVTRTTATNPGIVTNISAAVYDSGNSPTRAGLRSILRQDIEALSAEAKRNGKRKAAADEESNLAGVNPIASPGADGHVSVRRSSARTAPHSEGRLTGDRDGRAGSSILVSPLSYGRTSAVHAALVEATQKTCGSCPCCRVFASFAAPH